MIAQSLAKTPPRAPLTALARVTIGSHLLAVLGFAAIQVALVQRVETGLMAFAAVELVAAGLIALRWRWAPALGALLHALLLGAEPQVLIYDLSHPENLGLWAIILGLCITAVVGLVAGVLATIQNYRVPAAEQRAPRWLGGALPVLAALYLGAVLSAAIPREGSAGISPEVLAGLPAVTIADFNNGVIRVKAGELAALRLENSDGVGHSFDIDALDVHVAMPAHADNLALFVAPTTPGEYRFYCAPHYHKGSDSGMKGTLVVEP
jgi:plastocyanin